MRGGGGGGFFALSTWPPYLLHSRPSHANTQNSFTAAQPLHCVARVGHHPVAGADGRICLWDGRTGRRVGSFDDTHDGDVTCLVAPTDDDPAGAPSAPGVASPLLSAGVDGLVAVWDLGRGVLEDDAFVVKREREWRERGRETREQQAGRAALAPFPFLVTTPSLLFFITFTTDRPERGHLHLSPGNAPSRALVGVHALRGSDPVGLGRGVR